MPAPTDLLDLIERFTANRDDYHKGRFNETQVRIDYLNPLFELLGWDMTNRAGRAEKDRDVIHEDAIKVGGVTKAPDYCFRIGAERKFFVEAKKPSVNIKESVDPAFQLRRYGWSAKLPVSILTDFEEFAVYDCRFKPDRFDRSTVARIMYFRFEELAGKWDELAGIFGREAVLHGSFDRYAETSKARRGTTEVDDAFLGEIEEWRAWLAQDIAKRNRSLTVEELNDAVQRTIDRIIFLRICEDRGIEDYGRLQALRNGASVYPRLMQLFHQADARYNSGLFHFTKEKGQVEQPDNLTPDLEMDDRTLKEIFRRLYYPDSPYEFSVLASSILGKVYEQFLGRVITLDKRHRATIEEKPEVRKAGGVYYTPEYIARYIVEQAIGRLLAGRTPKEVSTMRFLDMACGSGSFVLVAYGCLLDWHVEWYGRNAPEKWAKGKNPAVYQVHTANAEPSWRLTTGEKKRILLNTIFGVDIDRQAVEVTKLSLLLKMLEGESEQTLGRQLKLLHERVLPDLGNNIKCGNSLIGSDFYDDPANASLDLETRRRINAFDWEDEFPEIMKAGGFDAVIGNPPYIRIQAMKEWAPLEVEFYKSKYQSASKGNYDIYVVFVEKGLSLLNKNGVLGYILPHKFFNAKYGEPVRKIIAEGNHLSKVVHFGDQQVFDGATTYTCLLFLKKQGTKGIEFEKVTDLAEWRLSSKAETGMILNKTVTSAEWNFSVGGAAELFEKLSQMSMKLVDVAERMAQGIRTSANEVYVLDVVQDYGVLINARSKHLDKDVTIERKAVLPFLQGRDIKPYRVLSSNKVVIVPYRNNGQHVELIPEKELAKTHPHTLQYLRANKNYLEDREQGRMRTAAWFGYVYPKNIEAMKFPKILVPDIANRSSFALDEAGEYAFTSGYAITLRADAKEAPKYILGILNSRLLDFFLKKVSTTMRGGFFRYFTQFIEQLPIREINFSNRADKSRHDSMVTLVDQMLSLHKQLAAAKTSHGRTFLERQIEQTDRKIDRLVYALYDLTEEEIAIVEGG